jgi:uncharacterized protein (TIRG00374 family)
MLKKHFIKILLGLLFSIIFIYLVLRNINIRNSLGLIKNTNFLVLTFGTLIYAFTYLLRSVRYYFIILPLKKTRIMENFPYTILGSFVNNIIPLRLGELIRAKITGERFYLSRSSVLATIIIERLFDVIIFVLFFSIITIFMSFHEFLEKSFYILAVLFIICLIVFYIMLMYKNRVINFLSAIFMPAKIKVFITDFLNKFIDGLEILKKPSVLIKTFIMSVVLWIIEAVFLVVIAYSCNIKLSICGAVFTVIIIGIGVIIPTAPGYIGAFEFMGVTALSALSIDKDSAFACIALYHLLQFVVIFTLGFTCALKVKLLFSDLFKFTKIEEPK